MSDVGPSFCPYNLTWAFRGFPNRRNSCLEVFLSRDDLPYLGNNGMTSQADSAAVLVTKSVPLRFAAAGNLLSIVARGINIVVVASFLSVHDQALFFTLSGLLGFQLAFELGFGVLLQNSASHEFARLDWRNGRIFGDMASIFRLSSLFRFGLSWMLVAGMAMVVVMVPGAALAYSSKLPALGDHWFALIASGVAIQAIDIPLQGIVAFLTGMRDPQLQVRNSTLVALLASTGSIIAACSGTGAFCLPIGIALGQIGTTLHLAFFRRDIIAALWNVVPQSGRGISWANELLPIQWRMGVAWLSGAFYLFYLPSTILPAYGPNIAAQYGLSNTICQACISVANSLVIAATPAMATLAANRDYRELDRFALRILTISITVLALFLVAFVSLAIPGICPRLLSTSSGSRLLPIKECLFLAIMSLATHFSGVTGSYLRVHRYEPMMPLTVIASAIATTWVIYASRILPPDALLAGCALINLTFGVLVAGAFTLWLRRKRNELLTK